MNQIIVSHATKTIKKRTVLDDVTVTLDRGGIYGFFGINGSGKTMLFRAIAGLIRLNSGTIRVFGEEIGLEVSFPKNMGLVIGAGFWDEYTGFNNLKMLASIRNNIDDKRIHETLEKVGLDSNDKRSYRSYSLGMKQRLELAQAIMEKPDLLILDEPTNSLDADGMKIALDIILEQQARGGTVLLASHNVVELEEVCNRRFKMHEGRLLESNATNGLIASRGAL